MRIQEMPERKRVVGPRNKKGFVKSRAEVSLSSRVRVEAGGKAADDQSKGAVKKEPASPDLNEMSPFTSAACGEWNPRGRDGPSVTLFSISASTL